MFEGINHRCGNTDCYALDENELIINIRTNKNISTVNLVHEDPYINGASGRRPWYGVKDSMHIVRELKECLIWSISVFPKFKRMQYYFEVVCGNEIRYLFEDGLYTAEEMNISGMMKHYFKYAWMNSSDIYIAPEWVADTFWYQIMPDRFCRHRDSPFKKKFMNWDCIEDMEYTTFYGGNISGITSKIPYLCELGINGIYLTPIFESKSNHKYNTIDYRMIDSDFGTEEDFKELVDAAHRNGIKVMVDAVFNHSARDFFAWKDVVKNGKKSKYYEWFYINEDTFDGNQRTDDGRYFSFAFEADMPKLNTNNQEVVVYFCEICKEWISKWNIDGIRFDVGNEIAHSFIKSLRKELKALKPDLYLLGEIWHDANPWLQGDEYDSVMNYPFMMGIHNFFMNKNLKSKEFMYMMNRCYSLYMENVNTVLFNFLDSHDVGRVYSRFCNMDVFFQQLVILITMPGSPCIYYGTEIAMEGSNGPFNRKPMAWKDIESGEKDFLLDDVKKLIGIRKKYEALKGSCIEWDCGENRLIHYVRRGDTDIEVYVNADTDIKQIEYSNSEIIYARGYSEHLLAPDGCVILRRIRDGINEC